MGTTPREPIAIQDLLAYLVAGLEIPPEASRILEIGGADQVSYGGLMREYAHQRGLRRLMIRVPMLSPRLSSLWLGLVTPLYARVGRKLVDSMRHATVVTDDAAARVLALRPMGLREAIGSALRGEDRDLATTRWSDALSSAGSPREWGGRALRRPADRGLRADPPHRRGARLVLPRLAVAPARMARSPARMCWIAPRPSRSGEPARRRRARLLARRGSTSPSAGCASARR